MDVSEAGYFGGYRLDAGDKKASFNIKDGTEMCASNESSGNDYFIPTRYDNEWDSFVAAAPGLQVRVGACCDTSFAMSFTDQFQLAFPICFTPSE